MTKIRDELVNLGRELDRRSNACRAHAERNALLVLDSDPLDLQALKNAKQLQGESLAYLQAMKMVDELRQKLERNE